MIIKHIKSSVSTNSEIADVDQNLFALWSDCQTKGRGQRGNSWESEDDKNLTFSIMLRPQLIPAEKQFILSKTISTVIIETLNCYGINATIKWPNDIYVNHNKICGILIECNISGNGLINKAIIGVGLNVNQKLFLSDAPNPTSMALECNKEFDREEIINEICRRFEMKYDIISEGLYSTIDRAYYNNLYRKDGLHTYEDSNGNLFKATINGISEYGALILEDEKRVCREFQFKEVSFVLPNNLGKRKKCPICGATFMCRHDNISLCHCSTVTLTTTQLNTLKQCYDSCLCNKCLKDFALKQ